MSRDPESRWTLFRPLDAAVALLLLALTALCFPRLVSPFGTRAEVTVAGEKVARLSLEGPVRHLTVATALGPVRLAYGGGSVRVEEAPCPNRLCMRSGPVSRSGAVLLCVPCKMRVVVGGAKPKGEVDAVTF
jgi:hypothetical protein